MSQKFCFWDSRNTDQCWVTAAKIIKNPRSVFLDVSDPSKYADISSQIGTKTEAEARAEENQELCICQNYR